MRIYRLEFRSALHVDSRGSGEPETAEEFIRSDTLSGAICMAWAALFKEDAPDLFSAPRVRISSAFPWIGETLLFPVPVWRIWAQMDEAARKRLKRVRWLSESLFKRVLDGQFLRDADLHLLPAGVALDRDAVSARPELAKAMPWVMAERQRVRIDRLGIAGQGGLFFFAMQFFGPDAGLWFLADGEPENLEKLGPVLDFLGDTGIGADRNSGLGHFRVKEVRPFGPPAEPHDGYVTLSLFNPCPEDLEKGLIGGAAYNLTNRSGWITGTTLGRPPIRVFTEGSYFPVRPRGRVVPMLTRETQQATGAGHAAPRDFRAFTLPCARPRWPEEAKP